jgi:hypothetical protein
MDVLTKMTQWPLAMPDAASAVLVRKKPLPAHGLVLGPNTIGALPPPAGIMDLPPWRKITLDPASYKWDGPRNPTQLNEQLKRSITVTTWATPRRAAITSSRVLTERTAHDLATQLRFEAKTPSDQRGGYINPNFVEWMMGLPRDWTKIKTT